MLWAESKCADWISDKLSFRLQQTVEWSVLWIIKKFLLFKIPGSLTVQFDFSGGQIDNIVRKGEIREVLYGEKADFMRIFDFCGEETFSEGRVGIGFIKNWNYGCKRKDSKANVDHE